jgi:hypothetical protein
MEMTEIEAPTGEVTADRDVVETTIDALPGTADFSTRAEGGMETRVLDSGGVEVSRIGADIRVPGPTESLYLKYFDLGDLKYETADTRQRTLIGSIASWVSGVARICIWRGLGARPARPPAVLGVGPGGGEPPSRKGVRGYYPRENFRNLTTLMCILETEIFTFVLHVHS